MNVYVFDIDNTISNSFPSLIDRKKTIPIFRLITETYRVLRLPFFKNMVFIVKNRIKRKNSIVFFLSARHPLLWLPTYLSLIYRIGFINPRNLILVRNTLKKIKVFELLNDMFKNRKIRVIDDLSYNHENGEIKYYEKVISFCVKNKSIIYFDKKVIDKINRDVNR